MKFKKLILLSSLSGVSLLPLISMSCSKQDESKTDENKPNTSEIASPSDDKDKDNTSTTPSTDKKDTNTSAATDNKTDKSQDDQTPPAEMMEHKANAKYSLSIKASKNDKVIIALNFKDAAANTLIEANKYALSIKVSDKELESQNEIIIEREVVGKTSQQPNEVVFELDITRKDKPYQRQEVSVFGLKYNNALIDNDKIEIEF